MLGGEGKEGPPRQRERHVPRPRAGAGRNGGRGRSAGGGRRAGWRQRPGPQRLAARWTVLLHPGVNRSSWKEVEGKRAGLDAADLLLQRSRCLNSRHVRSFSGRRKERRTRRGPSLALETRSRRRTWSTRRFTLVLRYIRDVRGAFYMYGPPQCAPAACRGLRSHRGRRLAAQLDSVGLTDGRRGLRGTDWGLMGAGVRLSLPGRNDAGGGKAETRPQGEDVRARPLCA